MECRNEFVWRHGLEAYFGARCKEANAAFIGEINGPGKRWQTQKMIDHELRLIGGRDNEDFLHGFVLPSEVSRQLGLDQRQTKPQVAKDAFGLLDGIAEQNRSVLFAA